MKQMKVCAWSTCHKLIPIDQRYCSKHQKPAELKAQKRRGGYEKKYNKTRYEKNPLTANYHIAAWKKTRLAVLIRDHYLCQQCLKNGYVKPAKHVDHIIPAVERPDLFWNMDNLQSLCPGCHSLKTVEEQKKRKRENNGR
ncbi:HNH endonuclease [Sporolactobacillus sp. CQH2019]|uniref:HNH endonuclease n=1 Tax=Sporolactobacillus sp. CQH2019 TaxID=3023512 RepID=UPI002368ACE4|nr:HNH endonuclease [Sporolactobacillus sp. CQH2019]MDD9149323.1 HNH endonuclease [Sporolactobacillus sp. CQH2019]